MARVALAVVPAAGEGKRWRPLSAYVPKEMLPVGHFPLIHHALHLLHRLGVAEVVVVTHEEKALLADYVADRNLGGPHVHVVYQERRSGVIPAVARALRDKEPRTPVLVLYPDNFFPEGPRDLDRFVEAALHTDRTLLAFTRLTEELLQSSGLWAGFDLLRSRPTQEGFLEISHVGEKGGWRPQSPWKSVGLWALHPRDLPVLRQLARMESPTEIEDVHLFRELALRHRLLGFALRVPVVDAGNPQGYILAWKKFLEARS